MKRYVTLLFLLYSLVSLGGQVVTINKERSVFINPSDYYILQDSNNLHIGEVENLPLSSFSFNSSDHDNRKPYYWLRLDIENKSEKEEEWLLSIFNHMIGRIEVFARGDNEIYAAIDTVGIDIPYYERNFHTRIPVFEIPVKKGLNTYYIKMRCEYYISLNTVLLQHIEYTNFNNKYYFLIGGFYFILLILILYNTLFYISTRDKIYLFYILFVFTAALDCLKVDHIGFAILWPNATWVNGFMYDYARPFFIIAMVNYTSYFLQIKSRHPKLYKLIWATLAIYVGQEVFSNLIFNFPYGLEVTTILLIAILGQILFAAIIQLKEGIKPVRIFMVGYASIFAGITITYLFYNGLIAGNHLVYYIMFYGITIDALMFSFALSSRLKKEREEKENALEAENKAKQEVILHMQEKEALLNKVNEELEDKVKERTSDLEEANHKLLEQAAIIQELNKNLDKENWKLNKEIKEINTNRILAKDQSFEQVLKTFPDKVACYSLIAELKWNNGFSCKKCGHDKAGKGNDYLSKRCSKCGTTESVTSNTIFHKLKFPIEKAFYLSYVVFNQRNNLNLSEIARETDLNYQTCSRFKSKIEDALEHHEKAGIKVKSWEDIILDN